MPDAVAKPGPAPLWRNALLWIFLLGFALRIAHGVFLSQTIYDEMNTTFDQADSYAYFTWAGQIQAGDWLGRDTYHPHFDWMEEYGSRSDWARWWGGNEKFHQAPLYPYLLAGMLELTNQSVNGVFMLQLLLGSLQPLIVFALARKLLSQRASLLAALLCAVYGPFIFHEGTLLRDWLPPMLGPLALWLLLVARERDRWWQWSLAGVVLIVGLYAKPPALPWIVLALGWLALENGRKRRWASLGRQAGLLLAGVAVALLPLIYRNVEVGAPALSVTTRQAEALIQGNAVDATPVGYGLPESQLSLLRRADGSTSKLIGELLKDYHGGYAPLAHKQWQKWLYMFDVQELPNNFDIRYGKRLSPVLAWTPGFWLVLPLGLAGLLLIGPAVRREPWGFALTLLFFVGLLATITIPPVFGRYRLAAAPYWMLFAGYFVDQSLAFAARGRWRVLALDGLILLGCAAFQQVVVYDLLEFDRVQRGFQLAEYDLATRIYIERRQLDRAADQIEAMVTHWRAAGGDELPREPWMRYEEGHMRLDAARRFLDFNQTAKAHEQLLKAESAFEHAMKNEGQPFFEIATVWRNLGETDAMTRNLHKYLERQPNGFDAAIARKWLSDAQK